MTVTGEDLELIEEVKQRARRTWSAGDYDVVVDGIWEAGGEVTRLAGVGSGDEVLDVACGTGEHARALAADGFVVDGIDLNPAFLRIAASKHPAGRFVLADMSDFELSQQYDAVLCLFSSVAYLKTLDRVRRAFSCFRDRLTPWGVVIVEPWFVPGVLEAGRVTQQTAEADGIRVSRVSRI